MVGVAERPEPRAAGDILKVKLIFAPMCTEFKDVRSGKPSEVLGHEASGTVEEAGTSTWFHVGDRVVVMPGNACGACDLCVSGEHIYCPNQRDVISETGSEYGTATYAQFIIKPERLLLRVPDDISLRHAALACCALGPSFNALRRMRTLDGETLVVNGCGPVGLGAIVNAVAAGIRVIAIEPHPYRVELALRLGADACVDPHSKDPVAQVRRLTNGSGVACAIETSGRREAGEYLMGMLRPLGRMTTLAWGVPVHLPPLVARGAEVHGCWHWNHEHDGPAMWDLVRRSARALDAMVTHVFDLDDVAEAIALQESGNCGKVLLRPHGSNSPKDL
jgi:threonine dehydrogenase-like Zn-dependent dehydrogenase